MSKTVAIVQSNYIPWRGYFDFISSVDEFILYDDAQYTIRDWRNRNIIKTAQGPKWLTIPVQVKGKYLQKINETTIGDSDWGKKHWASIVHSYTRARFFRDHRKVFERLYLETRQTLLSEINRIFLAEICRILGISTKLSSSMDYKLEGDRTGKLIALCRQADATRYISGPAARAYLKENLFEEAGIGLSYMDYSNYPEYEQLYPPFEPRVSIIDLIFNTGPESAKYLKAVSTKRQLIG
jgi:WbqC-like protein family